MSDTIIKVSEKTENFSIIINEVAKRKDLSARAKGIYYYLMTLPKDWKLYKEELVTHFTEGKDAINTAFKELEKAGYITKTQLKKDGKFDGWEYKIYESSESGLPDAEKPKAEKPYTGNPPLLNTNIILSTKQTKEKKQNTTQEIRTNFDNFYTQYPKKTNKTDAIKKFEQLQKKGISLEVILQKLEVYKKQLKRDNTEDKYIRNPARFLNTLDDFEVQENKKRDIIKQYCKKCGEILLDGTCSKCYALHDIEGELI